MPLALRSRIQDTSPIDPSGPGSSTTNARTCPDSTAPRSADRSGAAAPGVARPRSTAPVTFGASTAGMRNCARAGCSFPLDNQLTATALEGRPASRPASSRTT